MSAAEVVDIFASARGPVEPRPFPLQALTALTGDSRNQMALKVGTRTSRLAYAELHGCTIDQADDWATAYGRHPANVWPDYYQHIPPADDGSD